MPPLTNLAAFSAAAFVLIAIPGPSVLFVIGRALALGRLGGLLSVLGNAAGLVPQIVAVAFGVGAVAAQSVLVFSLIKFAGAAYLVYLGVQAIRSRSHLPSREGAAAAPVRRVFAEAFTVGLTNPKSIVFFVAVLPQFVDPRAGAIPVQMMVLGAVFLLLALVFDSVWALAAGAAREWFAGSPRRLSRMRATGGAMMIALGGAVALTDRARA